MNLPLCNQFTRLRCTGRDNYEEWSYIVHSRLDLHGLVDLISDLVTFHILYQMAHATLHHQILLKMNGLST